MAVSDLLTIVDLVEGIGRMGRIGQIILAAKERKGRKELMPSGVAEEVPGEQ